MADTRRTYPPRFDSSIPYAAQYNLDELSVYAEASLGTYFNIGSLPEILTLGKHYFTISFNDPSDGLLLKENTDILDDPQSRTKKVSKLSKMTVNELKKKAAGKGLTKYKSLTKPKLVDLLASAP